MTDENLEQINQVNK
jgi:hypothetical protein